MLLASQSQRAIKETEIEQPNSSLESEVVSLLGR